MCFQSIMNYNHWAFVLVTISLAFPSVKYQYRIRGRDKKKKQDGDIYFLGSVPSTQWLDSSLEPLTLTQQHSHGGSSCPFWPHLPPFVQLYLSIVLDSLHSQSLKASSLFMGTMLPNSVMHKLSLGVWQLFPAPFLKNR
jgi:hypothetical protein